jgi:hypothetical protein
MRFYLFPLLFCIVFVLFLYFILFFYYFVLFVVLCLSYVLYDLSWIWDVYLFFLCMCFIVADMLKTHVSASVIIYNNLNQSNLH